jgi:hypothetical protein
MAVPSEPTSPVSKDSQPKFADFRKTLAGDAVLIFLITCATYLTVYIFEAGYCHYFKVPLFLIKLEISTALLFAATSWFVLWFLLYVMFVYVSLKEFFERRKNPIVRRILLGNGPFIVAGLFLWLITGHFWFLLGTLLAACVFSLLLIAPNPEETLRQFDEVAGRTKIYPFASIYRLRERGLVWLVQIVVWTFVWASGWFAIGERAAKNQTEFLVTEDAAPAVVLRMYGDQFICAQFDRSTKICSQKFTILKSSEEHRKFELQQVGPLTPAPPQKP